MVIKVEFILFHRPGDMEFQTIAIQTRTFSTGIIVSEFHSEEASESEENKNDLKVINTACIQARTLLR